MARARRVARASAPSRLQSLYDHVAHGERDHRRWLAVALEDFFGLPGTIVADALKDDDTPFDCPRCGKSFVDQVDGGHYEIVRSGSAPATADEPAIYWFDAVVTCDSCRSRIDYSDSN